jgi:hypothetical protein
LICATKNLVVSCEKNIGFHCFCRREMKGVELFEAEFMEGVSSLLNFWG